MLRTFLSTALVAMLFLTGCGGSGKSGDGKNSDSGQSAGASAPSTLPAELQAEVGVQIDLASLMKDEAVIAGLEAIPDKPDFITSLKAFSLYVALPDAMDKGMDPTNYDFYAKLSFTSDADCKKAYDEIFSSAPVEDAEKRGKKFKKIAEPGGPTVYILQEGGAIEVFSEKYVDSEATSYASEGLRTALNSVPPSEQFKMGVDVASAKGMLEGLVMFAPQAEAFVNSKSLVVAGGTGETMFMMNVDGGDEETAKKVKQTIQAGLAGLVGMAQSQIPGEDVAPATNEMYQHITSNLTPKVDGSNVKIVIPKPDNYAELSEKMKAEAEKIKEEMTKKFGGAGGPGAPNLNPPKASEKKTEDDK